MPHREAKLLELFRAATEPQKQMVLGTLQSCVERNRSSAAEEKLFYILGTATTRATPA